MEIEKIRVQLDRQNKWFDCEVRNLTLKIGDKVIVSSLRGLESGKVIGEKFVASPDEQLLLVVRLETDNDEKIFKENLKLEKQIKEKTKGIVKQFNLNMKIADVLLSLDNSKVTISFTAEERVDFRQLVKELANALKMRIELRQIGSRDEVKIVGAMGVCGRPCCCSNYFNDFSHVSIKMAKIQNLSLNPSSISGICGRLMCCLAYENEYYSSTLAQMPKINSVVDTPQGSGVVVYNNLLKKLVDVRFEKDMASEVKTFPLEVIEKKEDLVND